MRMKSDVDSKRVWGIDTDEALHDPRRISIVTRYILDNFGTKTCHQFNSIFAVDSVKTAIQYYKEFKRQQAELGTGLKIATIFTYNANEEVDDEWGFQDDENPESTGELDGPSREELQKAIDDYNQMFGTTFSTEGEQFQSYYKDVSLKMKQKKVDLLIVVGMFLTGFDAKTLNTLWVDKNLKMHGLLQANSRTNRILNGVKTFGNIVCFRNLEEATKKSISIFGDEHAAGLVFMKSFDEYYSLGYEDDKGNKMPPYKALVQMLMEQFAVEKIAGIVDDEEKKAFIRLFGAILKLRNILSAFDEFTADKVIIPEMHYQDYLGWYNTIYEEIHKPRSPKEKENIADDLVFEMELVKQVQININYILLLVQQYRDTNCQDKTIIMKLRKQIDASPDMRDKRELIERFIEQMTPERGADVGEQWEQYIEKEKKAELDTIIKEEHLKEKETVDFIQRAFMDGYVTETGTGIAKILPPSNPFLPESGEKKQTVIEKLKEYLSKYLGTTDENYHSRKLRHVEDDLGLRNMLFDRIQMDADISDAELRREAIEYFGNRYPEMTLNDWRHIIEAYTPMVREAARQSAQQINMQHKDMQMAAEDTTVK